LKRQDITKKQKLFADLLPLSKTEKQAEISAGYSKNSAQEIAYENLRKPHIAQLVEKNLKQHLNSAGLDDATISEKFRELVFYNSEKVTRVVGEGPRARDVEEMRDARVVSSTLANIVKFKGVSLEATAQQITSDVNNDTAWLAIKSLLKKLTAEQLKQVIESCQVLLNADIRVVE